MFIYFIFFPIYVFFISVFWHCAVSPRHIPVDSAVKFGKDISDHSSQKIHLQYSTNG